jgi:hypothetical protein
MTTALFFSLLVRFGCEMLRFVKQVVMTLVGFVLHLLEALMALAGLGRFVLNT